MTSDTPAANPTRELAAIMFSDIAGYTLTMGRDEERAVRALREHRALLRSLLPRFNGRMLGEIGDGTLSSFHSAVDAVNCAREVQAAARDSSDLRLRIGIHLGDVLFTNDNAWGDGVNVASRIHALAPPGAICVSEHVYDEIRNKPAMAARYLGRKRLKNVSRPIGVYILSGGGSDSATVAEASLWARVARRSAVLAGIGALLLTAVAVEYFRWWRIPKLPSWPPAPAIVQAARATVAVLPFANMSASKDDEYFSDGVTDEIRGDLSKIGGLQVAARSSSFAFKGQNEDARKIARLLHVRNLLEGSVRRSADRVRIEVELIDASSGFALWSERYDEQMADVFRIQSTVAENVAEKLKVRLLAGEKQRVEKRPTDNLKAYSLYLQGNYYMSQWSEESAAKAMERFGSAIEKDPAFAQAYAGLGAAYALASDWTMAPRDAMPKARAYEEKALAIDPDLAEAHTWLGIVLFQYDWDWPGAERELKQALSLDPGSAGAHGGYGFFLSERHRYDEALPELERARKLDPLWPEHLVRMGGLFTNRRDYDRADQYFRQAIDMAPDYYDAYLYRGWNTYCHRGAAAAVADFEKAASLDDFTQTEIALGDVYARVGRRAEAVRILDRFRQRSAHRYVPAIALFGIYWGLGDKDRAFEWLNKAYQDRSAYMASLNSPIYDEFRSDPRFRAMVKKVGLDR
jgi:adenylate cyclase